MKQQISIMLVAFACLSTMAIAGEHAEHKHEKAAHKAEKKHSHDNEDKDHDHSLDAHEHGKAKLQILWSGTQLELELDTPAMNIYGFEGEPKDKKQRQTAQAKKQKLAKFANLFELEGVKCKVLSHHIEEEQHGHHSDLNAKFKLRCANADKKEVALHAELFEHFPATEELQVEWIRGDKAGQATLTPEHHHLDLPAIK